MFPQKSALWSECQQGPQEVSENNFPYPMKETSFSQESASNSQFMEKLPPMRNSHANYRLTQLIRNREGLCCSSFHGVSLGRDSEHLYHIALTLSLLPVPHLRQDMKG